MDWRKVAVEDLKHYREQKMGYEHTKEQISELDAKIKNSKPGNDKLMDFCTKREKLILARDALAPLVKRMDESLALLNDVERKILNRLIIDREKGAVERLCEELFFERTRVYEIRNEALRKFTVAMYGVEAL